MVKKIKITIISLCFIFILIGCNKKEQSVEVLPAEPENFSYTVSEEVLVFCVDDNGLLYTVKSIWQEHLKDKTSIGESERNQKIQIFEVYDLEGNCISYKELNFGTGAVDAMTVAERKIYCSVPVDMKNYVYVIDTDTWKAEQMAELTNYQRITSMLLLGDYLYVLGTMNDSQIQNYVLHPDVFIFEYDGRKICRLNVKEKETKLEKMKVDFPVDMYITEQNTLMIYQYTEDSAFGFLEFNPNAMTVEEKEWSHAYVARKHLTGCGEGYVYTDDDMMYYGTINGMQAHLLPEKVALVNQPVYQKGFLFLLDRESLGTINRFCVTDIIKENKEICMLTNQVTRDIPYGCGYQMNTYPVTVDEFALKVLAQDKDYDVYLLSSREECAYNLKKNGAFYPLNEVEGVQAYLDACFPYVKELATNTEGEIWMIPVRLAIPGIIYNKEYCEKNNVMYQKMDYLQFMTFLEEVESETPDLSSMAFMALVEELFMQYFAKYDSLDTKLFRSYMETLKEIYAKHGEWGVNDVYGRSLVTGIPAEFYINYNVYADDFADISNNKGASAGYGIIGVPKMEDDIGNVGTITFLAVNSQSENLKDTLKYITEFCNYMMNQKDSFMIADESAYTDNPFIREQYQLYANGDVDFKMEYEVFLEDFNSYLQGDIGLEEAIEEAERKRKIYLGE